MQSISSDTSFKLHIFKNSCWNEDIRKKWVNKNKESLHVGVILERRDGPSLFSLELMYKMLSIDAGKAYFEVLEELYADFEHNTKFEIVNFINLFSILLLRKKIVQKVKTFCFCEYLNLTNKIPGFWSPNFS